MYTKRVEWDLIKTQIKKEIKNKLYLSEFIFKGELGELITYIIEDRLRGNINDFKSGKKSLINAEYKILKILDNWDIKRINILIGLYPKAFPSFVKNGQYKSHFTKNGWILTEK